MGYDLPTAMGAAIARPGVPAICFVGDGSLQMNIQELATIAEHQMNVKIIVLDNHRLAMVSQFQNLNWGSDPTCGNKWNPDFAAVAQSYGIPSASAVRPEEVEATLMQVFATDGPFLAHFVVDPDQNVVPMLLADQTMDAMWNG